MSTNTLEKPMFETSGLELQSFEPSLKETPSPRTRKIQPTFHLKRAVKRIIPGVNSVAVSISERKPFQWRLKRFIDISASLGGLLALSPLLALVALAIRLESPGPVIYKQKRVGRYGKRFEIYKFRSMHQNADKLLEQLQAQNQTNGCMFKMFNDPRITKVGRFIRKYSIDELPQLFNVVKGNMSLVGPRPAIEKELENYESWHFFRFLTLPGLTGVWQVSGRSKIQDFDTVVQMDASYIRQWNLMLDFKLLLKTFPVVFKGMNTA